MLAAVFVLLFVVNPLTILLAVLITKGVCMSEVQDAVDLVVAQLSKAKAEIVSEIESLEAKVVSGEPVDLTALKAAAQALDDVVVDVPVADVPVEPVV